MFDEILAGAARRVQGIVLAGGIILAAGQAGAATPATNNFSFTGPEIFPLNNQVSLLHAADINGDGLTDLIVADNAHTKIDLLINETGKTNRVATPLPAPLNINQLPPGSRFHIESLPVDENISDMVVTDLNGDGRPDIAFYGDAHELEVVYNRGTNGWSDPKRFHIENGQMSANALAEGDLNGDGRTDLVLLGEDGSAYFLPQLANHTMGQPQTIHYSGKSRAVQIVDMDGDGRKDLLLVNWDSSTPIRFRRQEADGQLGPELYFKMPPIRSFCMSNLGGNRTNYLVTIAQDSGRAEVSQFVQEPAPVLSGKFHQGQFQMMPLKQTGSAQRGEIWADVNGDGRPDLLVAQPESGELTVYLQKPDGSLAAPKTYPSLAGVTQIAVSDWNGDGHPNIFLLSRSEDAVGVTHFDKAGQLPFPTLLPIQGKPLVMAVGRLHHGRRPELALIMQESSGRYLVTRTADGKTKSQKLSSSFTDDPTSMAIHDVNQDGLPDLVVLIPYDKVKVLQQKANGSFVEENVKPPGGAIAQPWMASVDLDGDGKPELLLPQKNFVRAVVMQKEMQTVGLTNRMGWVFRVKDQINGAQSDSQITGACAIQNGAHGAPAVFLLDSAHQQLSLCERSADGDWHVVRNIPLPVSDFSKLQLIMLGSGRHKVPAVALLGLNDVAWMPLAGKVWKCKMLDHYDTPIQDGYLNDETTGDLNHDGRKEIVFLDSARHYVDIVRFTRQHKLVPAIRWQVFEEHTFRDDSNEIPEPRQALVADVTGDGRKDLILLVHKNIIVYPQD